MSSTMFNTYKKSTQGMSTTSVLFHNEQLSKLELVGQLYDISGDQLVQQACEYFINWCSSPQKPKFWRPQTHNSRPANVEDFTRVFVSLPNEQMAQVEEIMSMTHSSAQGILYNAVLLWSNLVRDIDLSPVPLDVSTTKNVGFIDISLAQYEIYLGMIKQNPHSHSGVQADAYANWLAKRALHPLRKSYRYDATPSFESDKDKEDFETVYIRIHEVHHELIKIWAKADTASQTAILYNAIIDHIERFGPEFSGPEVP